MAAAAVTPAAGSNSQREWPPSLKNFVSKVFGQCTDSSRAAVEKELKQAIYKAYADNSLWSIDWESFRLQRSADSVSISLGTDLSADCSLNSTPPPGASTSGGKRKKSVVIYQHNLNHTHQWLRNELSKHAGLSKDEDMKNKRAKRFQESPTVLQPTQIKAKFKPVAPSLYGRVQGVGYASASTPEPEHNPVRVLVSQ